MNNTRTSLRVAGAQIPVTNDVDSNVAAISRAIAFARDEKADILLTPEGSLSGYRWDFDKAAVEKALETVTRLAREAAVGLALGTCFTEVADGLVYNQIRFYGRDGAFIGFHGKILVCADVTKDPPAGERDYYAVSPLTVFDFEGVTIAGLICNDMWANPGCTVGPDPRLAYQLSKMGARVILHASNGGRDNSEWSDVARTYHETNLRMRAAAGRIWIATADNSDPPDIVGASPSGVLSPDGAWACRAKPAGEDYYVHTIDLAVKGLLS
jgi:predicted amidohydrolase